jgi:hypothetical protein
LCINLFLFSNQLFSQNGYLYQAAYNGNSYEFNYNSIPKIEIVDAPEDTDWNRWSMLHDGGIYRLFFMPIGRSDMLYQFGYNELTQKYEYGYKSTYTIPILDLPAGADITSFSMLHDDDDYRLYFTLRKDKSKLLQCAYDETSGSFIYGYKSMAEIPIVKAPADTDWSRWAMLHDGKVYRLYFMQDGSSSTLYQFGFDGRSYKYGYSSDPIISIIKMPEAPNVEKFNMLHDGNYYRLYMLKKPKSKQLYRKLGNVD